MSEGVGLATIVVVGLIWFGVHERNRANDLQHRLESAQASIDELKTRSIALEEASDNLKQQMERFSDENWRDVVPDVKSAADDVDSAKDDLAASADDADDGSADQ